jgi:hypothetical protein
LRGAENQSRPLNRHQDSCQPQRLDNGQVYKKLNYKKPFDPLIFVTLQLLQLSLSFNFPNAFHPHSNPSTRSSRSHFVIYTIDAPMYLADSCLSCLILLCRCLESTLLPFKPLTESLSMTVVLRCPAHSSATAVALRASENGNWITS